MTERPDAVALLAQARKDFMELLLPALGGERRYEALMLANALGIAERELRAGVAAWDHFERRLHALLEAPDQAGGEALTRQLAAEIRAGDWDGHEALYEALCALTEARLAITNPKAIERNKT